MFLHLGADTVIKTADIIGVFDLDTASVTARARRFLREATKRGQVETVSSELPKSFVVCEREGEIKVYISQMASATLLKRSAPSPLSVT